MHGIGVLTPHGRNFNANLAMRLSLSLLSPSIEGIRGDIAMRLARLFWRAEVGATSIEYAMIGALVSILILTGATAIGTKLITKFTPISGNLN